MTFEQQIALAKRRVARLDKIDGFKDREFKTICAALEADLRQPESGSQYDALVMLEDLAGKKNKSKSVPQDVYEKMVLKIDRATRDLGDPDLVTAAMISMVVWNAVSALGQERAMEWIVKQTNHSMLACVKVRKRRGFPV